MICSLETPLSTLSEHLSQLETFCQGTDLHSQGGGEPRVYAAILRGVKELLAVTSGFPGKDCTVTPSAPSLHPFEATTSNFLANAFIRQMPGCVSCNSSITLVIGPTSLNILHHL